MTALLVLPDGREISSGEVGQDAILDLTLTAGVNDTQELILGSVCTAMLEAELLIPEGELGLTAGEEVTLYWVEGENREKAGIFVAEKPENKGNGAYSLIAYDRVSRLDKDVSEWLEGLQDWPYSLLDFGKLVCTHCGVELANTEIPNGDYEVAKFAARGITGRQLLFWVGEASGRFLRATPEGELFLDWYTPVEREVSFTGEDFYYQDTLTWSDYRTAPIDRVQLRFDEKDVGTIYPPEAAGNTYAVTGNYLLTAENAQSLLPVAEVLYGALSGVQYTPCKLTVPSRLGIREGQIVTVVTPAGERLTAYVMSRTASRGRDTLECTGSPTREASTAVTSQSYKALSGKILRLQTNVDGLTVENQDMAGRLTAITANVEGISARVEQTKTSVSDLREEMENLTVGGTNLLLDTDAPGIEKVSAEYDRYITSPVDGVNAVAEFATIENSPCGTRNLFRVKIITAQPNSGTTVAGLRFYNHGGEMPLGISFIPGEQYTMSCYARATSGAPKINMTMWGLTAWGWQDIPEEWTKFSLTFTATEAFNTTTTAWAVFSAHKSYVGTLEMTGFKIEKGNKATDWTPAPEDTQVQIDGVVSDVADQQVVITSQESRIASLELSDVNISAAVEKVRTDTQTTIEGVEEAVTRLEERAELAVTAEDVSIAITERLEDGVSSVTTETGYTFNQDGMRIAKSGEEMENRLDNTGMYVTRSGEGILTANNQGVQALNLTARQYLIMGQHARFEDYTEGRTACFWI